MDTVIDLLNELEEVLDNSRAVPFSNRVSVDKEELYEIITEIRMKLPNELKQSKWVIEERNKILIDAQKEADEIVKNAEERVKRMVDENEVTKLAHEQAAEIVDSAKKTSKAMRIGAMEYAEEVLGTAQDRLRELKNVVYNESIKTDEYFGETLSVLSENIQELRLGR
ncbi:MAG TPA: ATPase [Candidatus Coprocola pullicola]|nr:ATPase [Candidatus Coprocola pullicola]